MFLDMQLVGGSSSGAEIMCTYCGIMILARLYCTTLISEAQKPAFQTLVACQWGACLLASLYHWSSFTPTLHLVNVALQVVFTALFGLSAKKAKSS